MTHPEKYLRRVLTAALLCLALGLSACNENGDRSDGSGGGGAPTDMAKQLGQEMSSFMEGMERMVPGGDPTPTPAPGFRLEFQDPNSPLVIVPVSASEKRRYQEDKHKPWSPLTILAAGKGGFTLPYLVEISERTEFWAVFLDYEEKYLGKSLVFTWHHGEDDRLYCQPNQSLVMRREGFKWPVAMSYCWSDPATGGRLLRDMGLRSVMDYRTWSNSQCFGPRTVRLHDLADIKLAPDGSHMPIPEATALAEASVEICEPGVQVLQSAAAKAVKQ